jgi:hypothetical protein
MRYDAVREYVKDNPDELFRLFEEHRAAQMTEVGWRLLGAMACLVAGLVLPGAAGLVALVVALPMTLACMWSVTEHVACNWFLHLVTLHDVIRPREPVLRFDVDPAPYRDDPPPGG